MAGQPLATIKEIIDPQFGLDCLAARPQLALHVMTVISTWAFIESKFLHIINDCAGPNPKVATSMLLAIESQATQRAVILTAVQATLNHDDWLLFQAAFHCIHVSRSVRNQFAHDLWGYSDIRTDVLLLLSSKANATEFTNRTVRVKERIAKGVPSALAGESEFNPEGVSVWRARDLLAEVKSATTAHTITGRLWQLVSHHQRGTSADSTRTWLLNQSSIKQRLEKIRQQG